jgi:hypothetical protein
MHGKTVHTFAPETFLDSVEEVKLESNDSYDFLMNHCVYKEGAQMNLSDLNRYYRGFLNTKYPNVNKRATVNLSNLHSVNPSCSFTSYNICKSCRCKHLKGCCPDYTRTNRIKVKGVTNIEIASDIEFDLE